MLKGFKDFVMRGNLVELAVAFVIGGAFATVVTATVALIMDLVGKVGGTPDFSTLQPRRHLGRRLAHRSHLLPDPGRRRLLPRRDAVQQAAGADVEGRGGRSPRPRTSRC